MGTRKLRKSAHFLFMFGCLLYMTLLTFSLHYQAFVVTENETQRKENGLQTHNVGIPVAYNAPTDVISRTPNNGVKGKYKTLINSSLLIKNNFTVPPTVATNRTLRRWIKSHPIVFLHIGKNGGTSFDRTISPVVSRLRGRYIGSRHFDWSYIDTIQTPDVVVLLREPVSRAVSHFYFSRKKGILKTKGTISEYLRNPQNMLETRDIWQDGQAAVSWLTGTHIAKWVGIPRSQVESREIKSLDCKNMCMEAVSRLKQTLWFGFLSDQERSFEMLQWQLGYSQKIKFSKSNRTPHPNITVKDKEVLESLMPVDLWFYDYAKMLFEARWKQYKTGVYNEPNIPPFPEINCKSTRFILACNSKTPLGPLYHIWNRTELTTKQQMELIPKDEWI